MRYMSKRKVRYLLKETQYAFTASALFAAALAAVFMGRDNHVMTEMCQLALFLIVISSGCDVVRRNI